MVVTRATHHQAYLHEVQRLSLINVEHLETPVSTVVFVIHRPITVSEMEAQFMNTWTKEQIKNLPKFSGSSDEDVTKWLRDVDTIFDRATIQPPNRYIAIQSYLVGAAAKWFQHNQTRILDWSTFNTELLKAYKPALNVALFKLEQRFQTTNESVMEYYYDKMQLCSQADPTMSSTMTIHHLMKGLKHTLIPHVFRRRPLTPADFLSAAQDEEKIHLTLTGISNDPANASREYPLYNGSHLDVVNVVSHPSPNIFPDFFDEATLNFHQNKDVIVGAIKTNRPLISTLTIDDLGVLYKIVARPHQSKLAVRYIPRSWIYKVLFGYHNSIYNGAHYGIKRTFYKLRDRFYWSHMYADIVKHVQSCADCRQKKSSRRKPDGHIKPITPRRGTWERLAMDYVGPVPTSAQGNKHILVLTDLFSKFVVTKAVPDNTSMTAAKFPLYDVFMRYGVPFEIVTDNGSHFHPLCTNL